MTRPFLVVITLLWLACGNSRRDPGVDGGLPDGLGNDGLSDVGLVDADEMDGSSVDSSTDTRTEDAAACGSGTHFCGDRCAPNDHPDSCGDRCEPCESPTGTVATCDGTCGFECAPGYSMCDGVCVEGADGCGATELPDTCGPGDACGAAGECVGTRCVCTTGWRACAGGCCEFVESDVRTLAGVKGYGVDVALGADGTAYIAIYDSSAGWYLFESRNGEPITTLDVTFTDVRPRAFDMIVLGPDHLAMAMGTGLGGDGMRVELVEYRLGETITTTRTELGSGYSGGGVGLTEAEDGTIWVAWSAERNRDLRVAEVDAAREVRASRVSVSGSLEQVLVEQDPSTSDVHGFWGNRYTGAFRSGASSLTAGDPITTCPADAVAFRSDGTVVSLYDTYSSIVTHACIGGTSFRMSLQTAPGSIPTRLAGQGFAAHPDGTLLVSYYDTQRVMWMSSRDGERWSQDELSMRYREPVSGNNVVWTAMASNARGEVVLVSVPFVADMGPMQVVRLN